MPSTRAAFTLIELLVVIAVVAILSVVVVVVLNPAQLLKQTRDATRLSDLATLNRVVSLFESDQPGGSLGAASTTYFSIVDLNATSSAGTNCSGVGLPPAPSGWTYHCAASSTLRKTDGTGWVPVNFDQMSFRALAALPVDPVNTTSSGHYYTYTPGGSWKLTAFLESEKRLNDMKSDGGPDVALYELGSNLSLANFARGLVGHWTFDEGSGTTAGDLSGRGNAGTLVNGPTWQDASGCKVGTCLSFDGVNDHVIVSPNASLDYFPGARTYSFWAYNSTTSNNMMLNHYFGGTPGAYGFHANFYFYLYYDGPIATGCATPTSQNTWYHLALVMNRATSSSGYIELYTNGERTCLSSGFNVSSIPTNQQIEFGAQLNVSKFFQGRMDDIRLYNRALTPAEIKAIYNATK